MEILSIILASIWGKLWLAGIGVNTGYQCYKFSQMIKILSGTKSFFFCIFESFGEITKGVLWPITLPLFLMQRLFLKGAVDDFNSELAKTMGYDLEDDEDGRG